MGTVIRLVSTQIERRILQLMKSKLRDAGAVNRLVMKAHPKPGGTADEYRSEI